MHKNILLCVGITILFLGTCITPSVAINNVQKPTNPVISGNTLYVGGNLQDNYFESGNYTSIQSAINDAYDGDTVFVYDDSSPYYENIWINRSINLIGENRNTTVIDGNFKGSVITINSDNVVVCGFTLKNIKDYYLHQGEYGCIKIEQSKNILVKDNIINPGELKNDNYGDGIYLEGSSTCDNIIEDNIIFYNNSLGVARGVHIIWGANNNTIYNNEVFGCHNAIIISPYQSENTNDNIIVSNFVHNSNSGIGIHEPAQRTKVISNRIINCEMWGIFVFFADNNSFEDNIVERCDIGIDLSGYNCYNNSVMNNNISYNIKGIEVNGNYNTIYHNNFIKNSRDATAEDYIYNDWDNGKSGNYWDDYTGKDNDGDGIGDTPHIICDNNIDNYPLMNSYNGFDPNAPYEPEINGPEFVKPRKEYYYTFNTTDPNGDDIYFYITWGDGSFEEWIGPYASGEIITLSHTWKIKENHPIIARAKDINGLIGPWGVLEINMPRTRATTYLWLEWIKDRYPFLMLLYQVYWKT